jgi:hypothetical protein
MRLGRRKKSKAATLTEKELLVVQKADAEELAEAQVRVRLRREVP